MISYRTQALSADSAKAGQWWRFSRVGFGYEYRVKERRMRRRMTITLNEVVYDGLYRTVGKRRMSQFIEDLLRPHVLDTALDDGYRAMAADAEREAEALAWCNALTMNRISEG